MADRAYNQEYYLKNRQRLLDAAKKYYLENRGLILAREALHRSKNAALLNVKQKVRRQKNLEIHRQRERGYNEENREKRRLAAQEYRRKNKEKVRVTNANMRARKANVAGRHSIEDREEIRRLQNNLCAFWIYRFPWCDKSLKDGQWDHRMPLAKGGSNDKHNGQWLCRSCNVRKRASLEPEFWQRHGIDNLFTATWR